MDSTNISVDEDTTMTRRTKSVLFIAYVTSSAKEFLAKDRTLGPNDLKQKAESELQASWQLR
ncbi:hypothetical protein GB937_004734 [Aspergillus fischeri]|nr:hypothetical protein GB937_004734 [Aspergillus fischeri]